MPKEIAHNIHSEDEDDEYYGGVGPLDEKNQKRKDDGFRKNEDGRRAGPDEENKSRIIDLN